MESLHLRGIFLLLILFVQYPPVDANSAEVDLKEDFEDTKGAIRFRISKKNRQQKWPKEKVQKDKQRSTKHTYKTKDRKLI